MVNTLKIEGLKLAIYLGWHADERQSLQIVDISLSLTPNYPFKAMQTDELNDSICYETIEHALTLNFQYQTFRLLEHFAHCCYEKIAPFIPENTQVSFTATKYLDELRGTRSFTLTAIKE